MSRNLTFADAYSLQLKLRESPSKRLAETIEKTADMEICEMLQKISQLIQEDKSSVTLRQIKSKLKQIPLSSSNLVGTWVDDDGLDLLHQSIMNNFPEMVEFLLSEPEWFPPKRMPKRNPYGHLAGMLGFTECLKLIMQYRPSDYFSGSNQSHVIKLPSHIKKRFKCLEAPRSTTSKQMEKLLCKIKSSTEWSESSVKNTSEKFSDMNEVGNILNSELEELEMNKRKQDASLQRLKTYGRYSSSHKGSKGEDTYAAVLSTSHTPKDLTPKEAAARKSASTTPGKIDKIKLYNHKKYGLGAGTKPQAKHRITVDWDVLNGMPMGVVKGAGEKVLVTYTENAHRERPHIGVFDIVHKAPLSTTVKIVSPKDDKPPDSRKKLKRKSTVRVPTSTKDSAVTYPKVLEPGVRGKKKYKDFKLTLDSQPSTFKDDGISLRHKTPLSVAAQYGHLECVQMILDTFILKNHPHMAVKEPLTLATKAKSPDAIMLLMDQKLSRTDYQSAVLTAIREMYPDCLTALLVHKNKEKQLLFDGVNLYHILYSQSLMTDYRYEMLPTMTKVLINSNEDVNAHNVYCTFPMYTLINCAFNISIGKQIFYYVECLKILLENKANPHYDESEMSKLSGSGQSFSRSAFSSAINCILESAIDSTNFFEHALHSKIFMKKLITTVTTCDKTNRRLLNDVLFNYMQTVSYLGIDRYIIRCLLRYGANPDFRNCAKYAINVYFDKILPHLARFEEQRIFTNCQQDLSALMLMCRGMSYKTLREAKQIFLNEHLLQCPIQALPICRYFAYMINEILASPRSLVDLVAQLIWVRLKRNEKRAKMLPLSDEMISLILP